MFKTFREKAWLVVLIVWLLSMLARVETLSRANADPFYFLMSASIFIEVIWYKKYHLFRLNFWWWLLILIYTVFWIFFFLYLLLMVAFDSREIRIIKSWFSSICKRLVIVRLKNGSSNGVVKNKNFSTSFIIVAPMKQKLLLWMVCLLGLVLWFCAVVVY